MKRTLLNPTVLGIAIVIAVFLVLYSTSFSFLNYSK